MKTQMSQPEPREKQPPLSARLEGKVQGDALTRGSHFLKERSQGGRQGNGVGFFASSFGGWESEARGGKIDVAQFDARLAQATARGHGNRPRPAHPRRLVFERGFDGGLFGGGDFGFFWGRVPAQLRAGDGGGFQNPTVDRFQHDRLPNFCLGDGGVAGNRFAAVPFLGQAPCDVFLHVLVAHGGRTGKAALDEKFTDMPPAQDVGGAGQIRRGRMAQKGVDPRPSRARSVSGAFLRGALDAKNMGALGIQRRVKPQAGILGNPRPIRLHPNPPIRGARTPIQRSHTSECSTV